MNQVNIQTITSKGEPYDWTKQPRPEVTLLGVDGNAYSLMAVVSREMKRAGCDQEHIDRVLEEAKSADYAALIQTFYHYCVVS